MIDCDIINWSYFCLGIIIGSFIGAVGLYVIQLINLYIMPGDDYYEN